MITELQPYQLEALQNLRETIAQGVRRIVLQAATGAGKTKIAASVVDGALLKGNRMAFVVPAISLVDQTVESFYAEGIRDTLCEWSPTLSAWVCAGETGTLSPWAMRMRGYDYHAPVAVPMVIRPYGVASTCGICGRDRETVHADGCGYQSCPVMGEWAHPPTLLMSHVPPGSTLYRVGDVMQVTPASQEDVQVTPAAQEDGRMGSIAVDSQSYPFLALARRMGEDYGRVLLTADYMMHADRRPYTRAEVDAYNGLHSETRQLLGKLVDAEMARQRTVAAGI